MFFLNFCNKKYIPYFVIFTVSVLTFLIYGESYQYGYSNYDDDTYLDYLKNIFKDGVSFSLLPSLMLDFVNANWHPVTIMSLAFDFVIGNGSPVYFHITNSVIHVFNALFVYLIFNKVSGNYTASILAAMIFTVHPLNVETVIWVSERKGLISTFFALLSIYSYILYKSTSEPKNKYLSILFFALSLLSKPTTAPVLFVYLLLDVTVFRRENAISKILILQSLKENIVYAVILTLIIYFSFVAQSDSGALRDLSTVSIWSRVETSINNMFIYISKIFFPLNLAVYYPHPSKSLSLIALYFSLIVLWVYLIMRYFHKSKLIVFCLLFFFIQIFPLSGIFQTGSHSIALRYTYLPAIGLFFIVSAFLTKIKNNFILYVLSIIILLALIFSSIHQTKAWKSHLGLWEISVQNTEKNYYSAYWYSLLLIQNGEALKAANYFYDLIGIENTYYAHFAIPWIAAELIEKKRYNEAKLIIDKAIANNLKSPDIITQLVILDYFYFNKKQIAKLNLEKIITAAPNFLKAHRLYARILMIENKKNEAINILKQIKKKYPDNKKIDDDIDALLKNN